MLSGSVIGGFEAARVIAPFFSVCSQNLSQTLDYADFKKTIAAITAQITTVFFISGISVIIFVIAVIIVPATFGAGTN